MITSLRGYTIIEVMIVLAVTAALFISAAEVFSGSSQKTQFEQTVNDLQSQINSWANQVSTGTFPGTGSFTCTEHLGPPNLPSLSASPSSQSTNQDCLYIGTAILAAPGDSALHSYSVIGLRNDANGNTVTSLADASPTVAAVNDKYVLNTDYQLLPGVTIKFAKFHGVGTSDADLLMLYSTFQDSGSAAQALTAYTIPGAGVTNIGYPPANDHVDPNLQNCIALETTPNPGCSNPTEVGEFSWRVCLQDSGGNGQIAELTVTSAVSGITTSENIGSCSP